MTNIRYIFFPLGVIALVFGFIGVQRVAKADPWQNAPRVVRITSQQRLPNVRSAIKRDPFEGVIADAPATISASAPAATVAVPTMAPGGVTPDGSVPNPGGVGNPAAANTGALLPSSGDTSAEIYVTSTVVGNGKPPLAMIQNGADTDIVGIGDSIGKRRITRILSQGIEFDDGSRLAVSTAPSIGNAPQSHPAGASAPAAPSPVASASVGPSQPPAPGPTAPSQSATTGGVPVVQASPYSFGPLQTPQPGTTPAPVPHYYSAPVSH